MHGCTCCVHFSSCRVFIDLILIYVYTSFINLILFDVSAVFSHLILLEQVRWNTLFHLAWCVCSLFVFIFDFACINFFWYLTMFILFNLLYSFISHFPVYLLYSFILPYWIKLLFSFTLSCLMYTFSHPDSCHLAFIYFILPDITLSFISNCYLPVFSVIIYLILLMYLLSSFILSCLIYFYYLSHPTRCIYFNN